MAQEIRTSQFHPIQLQYSLHWPIFYRNLRQVKYKCLYHGFLPAFISSMSYVIEQEKRKAQGPWRLISNTLTSPFFTSTDRKCWEWTGPSLSFILTSSSSVSFLSLEYFQTGSRSYAIIHSDIELLRMLHSHHTQWQRTLLRILHSHHTQWPWTLRARTAITHSDIERYCACCTPIPLGDIERYCACLAAIAHSDIERYCACCTAMTLGDIDRYCACWATLAHSDIERYCACWTAIAQWYRTLLRMLGCHSTEWHRTLLRMLDCHST